MELKILVPEPEGLDAAAYLEKAATARGWHPDQGITAEEFILDLLDYDLHHWGGAPQPESRGQRVQRKREEERDAAIAADRAKKEAEGQQ